MELQSLPDFAAPETIGEPYAAFAYLRHHHPLFWSQHYKAWLLTRFDDVSAAQADVHRYSSNRMRELVNAQVPAHQRAALEPFIEKASRWMYAQDGKAHEDGRKVLGKAFTPRAINALADDIEQIVDDLLAQLSPQPELMTELFNKIPALILAHMFGIPAQEALKVRRWTDAIIVFMVGSTDPAFGPREALQAMEEMYEYFSRLVDERRQSPGADLVSQVIAAGEQAGMTQDDFVAQLAFILVAATTTSADQLGIILFYLLTHPQALAELKANPGLIPNAIEEALRICPAGQLSHRVVTEDVTLHGQTLHKGDLVYLVRAAANRDPRHFNDPDRFDIHRQQHDHLAFGRGPHFCMGTLLFKLEAKIAFTRLLQRFPDVRLIDEQPPAWRTNSLQFRGLSHIRVALQPAGGAITRCFSAAPWEKNGGYCRALRAGNLIVTSGTVAFDEQGNPYAPGDVYRQTRRCLEIIETALKQLGVDRTLVVATRMYTTDVAWWPQIAKAHQEFFSHCPPTTMLLGVNQLIAPVYLIEIEAQAWTGQ
ncbi:MULTISPECIES: cytochrome P450 [Pseudomonas fluorescens group]|uniref:Cytochrome P450 107B1 n=1 Tax=Pseudomonas fluorescens TaxID=294 RepID=A0A0D0T9J5_PSEFL|nr:MULTISPECIES: cytochrome P450 [Pseudomonas fluorescens group]AZE61149.1 putative cytochrome P450 hydroxylase [Pseudomonas synxantha]KIR20336.1 Cytochrome P450 107B1 [Pseudomonas fluorescens]